jgi:hypothetical protein
MFSEISQHWFPCDSSYNTSSLRSIFLPLCVLTKTKTQGSYHATGTFLSHSKVTTRSNKHNAQICIADGYYIYNSVGSTQRDLHGYHSPYDSLLIIQKQNNNLLKKKNKNNIKHKASKRD